MATTAARGSEQGLGSVVRSCRGGGARTVARPGPEPGEHVDRCRNRRPGDRARPHHPCSLGPGQRAPRQAVRPVVAARDTYWIVCPKATAKVAKIAAFRQWLLAEAADDA